MDKMTASRGLVGAILLNDPSLTQSHDTDTSILPQASVNIFRDVVGARTKKLQKHMSGQPPLH
jgi:hypothetical protein